MSGVQQLIASTGCRVRQEETVQHAPPVGSVYGNEGTPRHIFHPHGLPNFSNLVQSAVKFSNEFIEKDSVLGGVLGSLRSARTSSSCSSGF